MKKLVRSARDINRNGKVSIPCGFDQLTAQRPGNVFIKSSELKVLLFLEQLP